MSSASGRVALRALSGRLLGRVSADAPSFSGRTAAAAAPTQAGEAGRLSRGMRFLTGPATPSWALRASTAVLRGRGPVLGRHLASAPDFVPPTVASAAATDQPAAAAAAPATPTPPPSSDRPHPLDYTTLCALAAALRGVALPAKVDEVVQVDSHTACLRVRVAVAPTTTTAADDDEGQPGDDTPLETLWIWLCWHNMGARVTVGPPPPRGGPAEAYGFGRSLQAALGGGVLVQARCPVEYERCMELLFAESASAPADTALVLHANASDNFLALVSVGVRSVADAAAAKKKKTPSALPNKKAPRGSGSSKVVRLPLQPPRLAYGRIMAVSTARPGQRSEQARKRQAGADGLPPRPRFPVPGDKFQRPQPSVRHLVPSPSETLALWRSNIMAADADAMAARAAAAAKDDESDDESGEEEEAPPPPPPLPRSARPPKQPDSAVAACMARTYAGVGRATADEMCVAAGVDPAAPPATLDEDAWAALHSAWTRWLVALGASHYKLGGGLFGRPFSVLGAGAALLQGGPLDDRDPLARAAAAGALAATNDDPTVRLPVMARGDALDLMAAVDTYFRQVKVRETKRREWPTYKKKKTGGGNDDIPKLIKYTSTFHSRLVARRGCPSPSACCWTFGGHGKKTFHIVLLLSPHLCFFVCFPPTICLCPKPYTLRALPLSPSFHRTPSPRPPWKPTSKTAPPAPYAAPGTRPPPWRRRLTGRPARTPKRTQQT
jgi:hypothetical protein